MRQEPTDRRNPFSPARTLLALAAAAAALFPATGNEVYAAENNSICSQAAIQQERRHRIPSHLLQAIGSVESGRWDEASRANISWPWTVTSQGEGKFYPSKQAAIRAVNDLQSRGIRNIDVGCMQINLGYHGDAFADLEEAFDPSANTAYAAAFLKSLRKSRRSWTYAIRFYHSSDPQRQRYYSRKVYSAQREIRKRERREQLALNRQRTAERRSPGPTTRSYVAGSVWPPRDYRAQQRMQWNARALAFKGRRR